MIGMRKHIHRRLLHHPVLGIHPLQIPRLRGRIAAHIDNTPQTLPEQGIVHQAFHHLLMHPFPGRIGDNHIRHPVFLHETRIEHRRHIPGKKLGIGNPVQDRIDPGNSHRIYHKLDPDHLPHRTLHVLGHRPRAGI